MAMKIPLSSGESLEGILHVPAGARGIVIFAHGSGSSSHSPRNQQVAEYLRRGPRPATTSAGFSAKSAEEAAPVPMGTLLVDLLTEKEGRIDDMTRELRFDISMLADRLVEIKNHVLAQQDDKDMVVGFFGASTGGGAALEATARDGRGVACIVSRGGRPDLASAKTLDRSRMPPVLLIVGGRDQHVLQMNEQAARRLRHTAGNDVAMAVVPMATHLFEEPGAMEDVCELAHGWFARHFQSARDT